MLLKIESMLLMVLAVYSLSNFAGYCCAGNSSLTKGKSLNFGFYSLSFPQISLIGESSYFNLA